MAQEYAPTEGRPFKIGLQLYEGSMQIWINDYTTFAAWQVTRTYARKAISDGLVYKIQASDQWIADYLGADMIQIQNSFGPSPPEDPVLSIPKQDPPVVSPPAVTDVRYRIDLHSVNGIGLTSAFSLLQGRLLGQSVKGWLVEDMGVQGNTLSLIVKEEGSVTITTLALILAGIIGVLLLTRMITYTITRLDDNSKIEGEIDAITKIIDARSSGLITEEEAAGALDLLKDVQASDPATGPSMFNFEGLNKTLMLAVGGLILVEVVKKA